MSSAPPFQHTPYDGSSSPFTVGLKPIPEDVWLEPDPFLARHLANKDLLFRSRPDAVFRAGLETGPSQEEVLELVVGNLRRFHGKTHRMEGATVFINGLKEPVRMAGGDALLTASRLVQEDLVIMSPSPEGYRLAAASLCFPSSWSLAEKFGQSMTGIHETVPGFNGSRMGMMVARLFDNLKPGQLVCRFNWSLHEGSGLHHPEPRVIRMDMEAHALAGLFLRVERQTLRRLEGTGDILFTIKIHHDPLTALEQQDNRAEIAAGLRRQMLDLDADQLAYKGLTGVRDTLAGVLEGFCPAVPA